MSVEQGFDSSDDSFWHEHSKELVVGSALGLLGLALAIAARRTAKEIDAISQDMGDAPNSGDPSGSS